MKMRKQRLMGLAMLAITALILVIYADPPWKFSSKEATGKTRGGGNFYHL